MTEANEESHCRSTRHPTANTLLLSTTISTLVSMDSLSLDALSSRSRLCIERLREHKVEEVDLYVHTVVSIPGKFDKTRFCRTGHSRLAAVLVLLYEKSDELRVLLTTRAKTLRAHPGETALPGGKVDESDVDAIATAVRARVIQLIPTWPHPMAF